MNELTTRDTDSNASVNYTLTYDAAGNLTDDGESYKYVYDAFGRMRTVKNQSNTVVAEYGYNGLGHMIKVLEDTDADGDADGSDVTFYPAYDEGWREVARYRSSDTSPKEEFVNAMAGLDGHGGASYINDVICRNRDNTSGWLAASDGTLEERYYYCPNWRGDVVALVHSARYMAEWVKYSPYGIPFGLPGGDSNSDGDCDGPGAGTDTAQILAWHNGSIYDVRGDVDLDGDVDGTDWTLALGAPINGNVLGWGNLSDDAFRSNRTFGGYVQDRTDERVVARHRVLLPRLGRWTRRDPAYADLWNGLYAYASCAPVSQLDPYGLFSQDAGQDTPKGTDKPGYPASKPKEKKGPCDDPKTDREKCLCESQKLYDSCMAGAEAAYKACVKRAWNGEIVAWGHRLRTITRKVDDCQDQKDYDENGCGWSKLWRDAFCDLLFD